MTPPAFSPALRSSLLLLLLLFITYGCVSDLPPIGENLTQTEQFRVLFVTLGRAAAMALATIAWLKSTD